MVELPGGEIPGRKTGPIRASLWRDILNEQSRTDSRQPERSGDCRGGIAVSRRRVARLDPAGWTGDRYRLQRGIRTRRRRPALHVASAEFAVRSLAGTRKR